MSDVNGTHIYTGAWTNYAKGRVHGATITLSQRDGGLLTSFIAAFVSYVGTRFWQILAFAIHQLSAKRQPRDALHLQRQVIWRNTSDPGDAAWSFYEQAKAWRSTAHRALWRTVPWMLFAGLYMAAFAALATLSGETPKAAGNDRLIRSPRCGLWGYDTFPDGSFTNQGSAAYLATMTNNSNLAANYAKTCYNNDPDPLQCSTYIQPSLSWKADDQAECPFGSDVCPETVQAFKMTSNLIDSRADLGFNTPTSHRLQFKKITTCTPLVQEGFTRKLDCGEINPARKGDQCILYDYGPDHPNNWTYLYNAHASVDGVGYTVDVIGSSGGFWQPVPSLYVHNADTTLIFIAQNSVQYDERCNDPIFSAEKFYNLTAPDGGTSANTGTSYWGPTFDVGIIGCAEQYQFCNPTTGVCSPLLSYGQLDAYLSLTKILPQDHLDAVQTGLYLRIAGTVPATDLISTIFFRQSSALQAQSTLESLQQHYLPPNQWIIELSGWFQTSLARLQSEILAYVTGPTNIVPGMRLIDVQDKAIENLCNSQLIQDTSQTVSFSVLIIAIIFALGGIIIITSFCLEPLLRRILPENENRRFRRRNWKLDSTVHLQRRLYQSLGMPRWEKPTKSIPITKEEILIKNWNDINPQHPALSELNSESIKDTLSTGERSETKDSMVAKEDEAGDEEFLIHLSDAERVAFSIQMPQHWHPELRPILELQDPIATACLRVGVTHPHMNAWQPSAYVILIGNAAHVLPLTGGVGATTALIDAWELCQVLARLPELATQAEDGGPIPNTESQIEGMEKAIGEFEAGMRKRARENIRRSLERGKWIGGMGDWQTFLPLSVSF